MPNKLVGIGIDSGEIPSKSATAEPNIKRETEGVSIPLNAVLNDKLPNLARKVCSQCFPDSWSWSRTNATSSDGFSMSPAAKRTMLIMFTGNLNCFSKACKRYSRFATYAWRMESKCSDSSFMSCSRFWSIASSSLSEPERFQRFRFSGGSSATSFFSFWLVRRTEVWSNSLASTCPLETSWLSGPSVVASKRCSETFAGVASAFVSWGCVCLQPVDNWACPSIGLVGDS